MLSGDLKKMEIVPSKQLSLFQLVELKELTIFLNHNPILSNLSLQLKKIHPKSFGFFGVLE